MLTTLHPSPFKHAPLRPVRRHRIPVVVKPSQAEQTQLHRDRMAALFAVLAIIALMAALIWLAMSSDTPPGDIAPEYFWIG